ncbi:MAG: hypothetical protein LBM69_06495, partial [Lachnospiraceae bacterium]|nr:hypothetical protein [Lachnospiraceae bacterium]
MNLQRLSKKQNPASRKKSIHQRWISNRTMEKLRKRIAFILCLVMMLPTVYIDAGLQVMADEQQEAVAYDPDKIDVWDFGAEQLEPDLYNNMLQADTINAWYPGVAPGLANAHLASFAQTVSGYDLAFSDGGLSTSHEL